MTIIGASLGIQFSFEAGLLSDIRIERHRKSPYRVRENISSSSSSLVIQPIPEPYPAKWQMEGVPEEDEEFKPYPLSGKRVIQEIGVGRRQVDVLQCHRDIKKGSSSDRFYGPAVGILNYTYQLNQSIKWEILIPNIESVLELQTAQKGFRIQFRNNTSLEIISSEALQSKIESFGSNQNIRLCADLPIGLSKIKFQVRSLTVSNFSDTVIVCRPDQLKDAAIVLSCLPSDRFVPLLVLEPPPIPYDNYKTIYKEFLEAKNEILRKLGGQLGREDAVKAEEPQRKKLIDNMIMHHALQDQLTPFRSWAIHYDLLQEIFHEGGIENAILLFDEKESDLSIHPIASDDIDQEESSSDVDDYLGPQTILSPGVNIIRLIKTGTGTGTCKENGKAYYYDNLGELTDLAWKVIREGEQKPKTFFDVIESDNALFMMALYYALNHNIPLRVMQTSGVDLEEANRIINENIISDEAVLIECTGNSVDLLGVLYAFYRKSRLVVVQPPDLSGVNKAIEDLLSKQESTSKDINDAISQSMLAGNSDLLVDTTLLEEKDGPEIPSYKDQKQWPLIEKLSSLFKDNWQAERVAKIEETVSEQIPDFAIEIIGERRLTALTIGLPYSFLKKKSYDWSKKPIGHVVGDVSLIILGEIYRNNTERGPVKFSLIFDPGYFDTPETEYVINNMERHYSYPILLKDEVASSHSLISIPKHLPIEAIYFNTHGNDNAIMLSDMPLRNDLLVQWLKLPSWPIVFNNSCLSWTGVGKEFIRVGARGYIGTLWSVSAKVAANYSQQVMQRLTTDGLPVSLAIRETGVDSFTERAFIFVGTANTHLDQWRDNLLKGEIDFLVASAVYLLRLVLEDITMSEASLEVGEKLYRMLLSEGRGLVSRIEGLISEPTMDLYNLYTTDLAIIYWSRLNLNLDEGYIIKLSSKCVKTLDALHLETNTDRDLRSELFFLFGRINIVRGEMDVAVQNLLESIEYSEEISGDAGGQYLELVEAYKYLGLWEKAKEAAHKAKDIFEANKDDYSLLRVNGKLGQIFKRMANFEEALKYARDGYVNALKVDDRNEQAVFKADEAQILQSLEQYDEAIDAAKTAIEIARNVLDNESEMKVYGILGECYLGKGDFLKATENATRGLEQARRLNNKLEEAAFLVDLGLISQSSGDIDHAIKYFDQSSQLHLELGHLEKLLFIQASLTDLYRQTDQWQDMFRALGILIIICNQFPPNHRAKIISFVLGQVVDLVYVLDKSTLEQGIGLIRSLASKMSEQEIESKPYLAFMSDVMLTFLLWIKGDQEHASSYAANLDKASNGVYELSKIVANPYKNGRNNRYKGKLWEIFKKN